MAKKKKNNYEVGKKCICIYSDGWEDVPGSGIPKSKEPEYGDILTIKSIEECDGTLFLLFKELKDQYNAAAFRVLDNEFAETILAKITKSIIKEESLKKLQRVRDAMTRGNKKK